MPNNHETLTSLFADIADAIREKTGSSGPIVADNFPEAISAIQGGDVIQHAEIPDYVKTEALALAEKVKAKQTANSITFIVGSDSHQNDTLATVVSGNLHAGMAMKILAYALQLDFAAFLGDYTTGNPTTTDSQTGVVTPGTTIAEGSQHIAEINADLEDAFRGLPQFRTTGNHDPLTYSWSTNDNDYLSEAELYPLIGAFNGIDNETVYGDTTAGYCYRDFPAKKVRVICLNTAENTSAPSANGTSEKVSTAQVAWLKDVLLDVGDKGVDWSVIILSHHPLDWGAIKSVSNMLGEYVTGSGDFAGHNLARIIGAFHGHTHCYKYARLKNAGAEYDAYRIAIPNMCFGRNNEYGRYNHDYDYGETVSYDKTADSANDTAFCVVTIDLSNKIIYAYHYGAGPAANSKCRAIPYDFGVTYYDVTSSVIRGTFTGSSIVAAGSTYSATLTPDTGYTLKNVTILHNGVDVTSTVYNSTTGVITIPNVEGDISVEAVPYTNLIPTSIDTDGNIYNDVGYKDDYRLNSSGGETSLDGCIVSGFIPYAGGQVVRVAMLKSDSYASHTGNYIIFYDSNKNVITGSGGRGAAFDGGSSKYGSTFSGGIWTLDPDDITDSWRKTQVMTNAAFVRVSLTSHRSDEIPFTMTLDEPI